MKYLASLILTALVIVLCATDTEAGPLRRLLHRHHGASSACASGSCATGARLHRR